MVFDGVFFTPRILKKTGEYAMMRVIWGSLELSPIVNNNGHAPMIIIHPFVTSERMI